MLRTTKEITPDLLIADIVNTDYRTADVFRKHNIDFCCGGKMSLTKVCEVRGLPESGILRELQKLPGGFQNAEQWPVDFMIAYLINIHHMYFKDNFPVALDYINRFISGHIKKYPEMERLPSLTNDLFNKLNSLLGYEKNILFPSIAKSSYTCDNKDNRKKFSGGLNEFRAEDVEQYQLPIRELIIQIERLSNNFLLPGNACTTQKVMLQKLHELITYIRRHLYLEKKILIPAILKTEKASGKYFETPIN